MGKRVLREQVNVARVESFSFVEIGLALIPLASSACDIGKVFRDPAAIRKELTRLLEITRAIVVLLQAGVMIIALGQHGLAQIGLKRERGFGRLSCFLPQRGGRLNAQCNIPNGVNIREQGPTKGELRIEAHSVLEIFLCAERVGWSVLRSQGVSQTTEVGVMGLRV